MKTAVVLTKTSKQDLDINSIPRIVDFWFLFYPHGTSAGLRFDNFNMLLSGTTSVKTRNVLTRADTLGVSSRWESEDDFGARSPESRVRTAMTSTSYPEDGSLTPTSLSIWKRNLY